MGQTGHKWDVLGIGCVAVDELLYLAEFPHPDSKVRVRERRRQCGGLTATALVAAARMGARCAFAGVLGDDEDSRFVLSALATAGVDTSAVVVRPGARPIRSTILVEERHHTRTILYDLAGSVGAAPDAPSIEALRDAKVLLIDHYGIEGMSRAARIVREAGGAVVADFERHDWPGFAELLALVDHLIVSRGFARRFTGSDDPAEAGERLWTDARELVAITDGANGCWFRHLADSERVRHQPAFRVEVRDTTGCGDVFHGVYAAGLAWGLDVDERLRLASAAAAIKATRIGGQAGVPTREEVESFLSEAGERGT